ncbi:hypothetical protein L7F22_029513 [Adiantum nelumboides]|nr:hypothetical protein [Adiantum nelumboides]
MQTDEDADDVLTLCEEEGIEDAAQQLSLTSGEEAFCYKLRGAEAVIRVQELRSKGLSFQIWPAAHALCWYLEETFSPAGMLLNRPSHLFTAKSPSLGRNLRVLELGAGTGMVGILCAVLGAHSVITDLPHVIPNLEYNAKLNEDVIQSSGLGGSVVVKMLRWGERADVEAINCSFDLIVASDVVYYDHLFGPLLCTLKSLLLPHDGLELNTNNMNEACKASNALQDEGAGVSSSISPFDGGNAINSEEMKHVNAVSAGAETSPTMLLAHLRRWKKDSHFFKKAAKLFQVTVVHKHSHDANSRTGVTVYSFSRKK